MKLEPREIIKTCTPHYQTWKEEAIRAKEPEKIKRFLEKAFFWSELQNNLIVLWTIENTMGNDENIKKKVEDAQININKKIMDYANTVIKDFDE
ncbi:MAG: hypothetical protein COY38_01260 [Candidatus Aenigmarchaeota archaeon CG_4_10_14_0_8_um_filter_37_24]|nr:hypothetical protein [Candidatus Aenigmarchaeota archaeon]OIN88361.1 MAG: hypothetical protein AUJ50_01150 [Candidatus Aenigmarchaeota archaeon CG1_02_38_14]PIV68544.1 MAG: hypothetical protein COS07_03745 [Candidatus Aenigmarchaeota archaeon CG01_land_8_20_14_3_00_37_9]PIW40830.1 MAG: hypothetical protein COW21_05135 [Candidatus Aenigmarchaeota archaeon CG15_BIG_FIL_POST_REV_8_21_14_020_37_27]PIX50658.1 MAG: hypothetical protein COZ52_02960 [Candidatus Aenigmarchaeota archaeon CG_4_8_14_3_u